MTTVARLMQLAAPFRRSVATATVLSFVTIAASVALLATAAYLISRSALVTEVATLTIAVTGVRLFAILRATSRYGERLVTHRLAFNLLTHLRAWFYAAIEPLAPARLSRYRSGDLLARSIADVETLEGFYVRVVAPPAAAALVAAGACLLLAFFDWRAAVWLLATLVLAGGLVPLVARRLSAGAAADLLRARADLNALAVDQVRGAGDLLVFDQEGAHNRKLEAAGRRLGRAQRRAARVTSATGAAGGLLAWLAAIGVLALAGEAVASGDLAGVYLALIPLVALASFEAVQHVASAVQALDVSAAAGKRLFELIDEPPDALDPSRPAALPAEFGVEVRELGFRYHPEERPVLDGLSFDLPPGARLAIAGESGAGKSTLVDLLVRFREYGSGHIRIGGRELRDYDGDTVRSLFAVMPQEVYLFNTTLRDNLLLADPDRSDAEILAACSVAQLAGFVEALPEGLDTRIGEDGLRLSGGERQRLALARALLKDAPVVILDEPTANLDAETERRLVASLDVHLAGRTLILISHRPAVWAIADRLIALENGRAVEVFPPAG